MRGGINAVLTIVVLAALLGAGAWFGFLKEEGGNGSDRPLTDPVERGPLRVTVMESGSLEALESHQVVNHVEGRTAIDYLIPEGTVITPRQVEEGLLLVRLNTADLEEKRVRQEIEVSAATDAHANAVTNLEIQLQQNRSDLRKARLDVRFALLDLERYVGKEFASRLQDSFGFGSDPEGDSTKAPTAHAEEGASDRDTAGKPPAPAELDLRGLRRLIHGLLDNEGLTGEALQKIREFDSDIYLAEEDYSRAEGKMRQSAELEKKGYVSSDELEADRLALQRRKVERERARTAREQFVEYDFSKQVEKLLSEVVEAKDRIVRAIKKAQAAEAQKRSAVVSKQRQAELKKRRLVSFLAQEKACVIRAPVPGLIVYASSGNERRWGNSERIQEGATVRQGQALITIPRQGSLGARISVHETVIDRVQQGQDAWIVVDAVPGSRLPARVKSVARLPNPADRWLNPDLKVYTTLIELKGEHPELKPGMSSQVEILITVLQDVIAVPTQTIAGTVEAPAVYVWQDGKVARRPVTLGLASEHRVQIKEGVEAGERLLLDPPREKSKPHKRPADDAKEPMPGKRGAAPKGAGTGRGSPGRPPGTRKTPRGKRAPGSGGGRRPGGSAPAKK